MRFTKVDAAYHEAGHAVIARTLGIRVPCVALFPLTEGSSAVALSSSAAWDAREDDAPSQIAAHEKDAEVALAGPLAQFRYRPFKSRDHWADDLQNASSATGWMVMLEEGCAPVDNAPGRVVGTLNPDQNAKAFELLKRVRSQSDALVAEHWPAIERVAQALLQRPLLDEAELDALIADRPQLRL
jgi:hypothetical protein